MRAYVTILILLLPLLIFGRSMEVVSESPGELIIDFTLPKFEMATEQIAGSEWQKIVCDEGSEYGEAGNPALLSISEAIGIPVDGDVTLEVLSSKSETIPGVNLRPIDKMVLAQDDVKYEFYRNNRAYSRKTLYPELMVEKGVSAFIGDRHFTPLIVYPFQYRASTKELVVHHSMRIRISISGSKSSTKNWQLRGNPIDEVGDSFFLNNSSSQAWRVPRNQNDQESQPKTVETAVNGIQLLIDKPGIYKVTYQYLKDYVDMMIDSLGVEMAWDVRTVDPRFLELSSEYGQIPIAFYGESDGDFDQGDYFEFYGDRHNGDTGYQDDYTAENVYTLRLKTQYGARMMVENGGLITSNPTQYIVPDSFESSVHLEEQLVSDKLGNNWSSANPNFYREDVWFWKKISAPNLDVIPFDLQYPRDSTIRTANVKVSLQGLTYSDELIPGEYDHEATVRVNQAMINTHTWIGQTEKIFENVNPIPNTFFHHGTNYLYISLSGNTPMSDREQVMLDYADLKYWREYKTSQDWIKFTKPSYRPAGLYQFQLEGFSNNDVSLYKIGSSVFNNLQIEPYNQDGSAPWTVTFQDSVMTNTVQYYAVTESQKMIPKVIRLDFPSNLRSTQNSGDIILVCPRQFIDIEGTNKLIGLWENNGYTVKVVDIQDIYDEFNGGIASGEAIRDFARFAYENWSAPYLNHLILLGEGVDDTRDNSPSRVYNVIPVKKTWTYELGATASDNYYACVEGDDIVGDISVARISAWKPEQVLDYANKAERYYNDPATNKLWSSHITLAAGGKSTDNSDIFSQQSEIIKRRTVSDFYRVARVYTSTSTVGSDYGGGTFQLKDAINTGTSYVQFMGHGGGRIWADYNLFNFMDVATLNNTTYPLVTSLCCYASAFDTNGASSISEALILQPNKGAIATIGFSGLGYLSQDLDYGLALMESLFKHDFESIGDALVYTKARFYTTTSSTAPRYALTNATAYLGDPILKMRKPITGIDVTAGNLSLAPGDTLRVTASFPQDVSAAQLHILKANGKLLNVPYDLPVIQGTYQASYVVPANTPQNTLRQIYVAGYSPEREYIGLSAFGVGRPSVYHQALIPESPAWQDSVAFEARAFGLEDIISMVCKVRTDSTTMGATWETLPMAEVRDVPGTYRSTAKLSPQRTGKELFFKYTVTTNTGTFDSFLRQYVTRGPDLLLTDIQLVTSNDSLALKVKMKNIGDAASIPTDLKLYYTPSGGESTLYSTQVTQGLGVNEERWETLDVSGVPQLNLMFEVWVNSTSVFPEWHIFYNTNNVIQLTVPFNYHIVSSAGAIINSVDGNLSCEIPANLVSAGSSSAFYVNSLDQLLANEQPDTAQIKLRSYVPDTDLIYSVPYEIRTLDSSLADSTGTFLNGKKLKLTYYYNVSDSLTQYYETENSYKIYRWDSQYRKWLVQGGNVSTTNNTVIFEVAKQGIYSVFRNKDRIGPSIDVNVQDQEFTVGGYVSGKGTISLLLSDSNGINVIDNTIKLYLNGELIPTSEYALGLSTISINRIPIKYQLDLPRGNYTLLVDCTDVNGNFNSRAIQFFVNDKFDIQKIGNYPNPVLGRALDPKNDGRTRFTYVLTDDADDVTIKIYTISGRLVRTFSNLPTGVGYHEYPRTVYGWDCKDEQGFFLANGTYFYKIIATKGSKKLEKTMKMAILK
ncbi:MAG TPA: C25 family cysteine peptidase [Candidatus Cloacimonadota bacterium]|nr:C25 family cysteine peptidase [Candidatus Cloacimonadota bacterium]